MQSNERKNTENFKITGNWDTQSQQLRETYPQLTETDVKFEAGKEEELLNRVSSRLGKKREEVTQIINKNQNGKAEKQPETKVSSN